MKLIQQYDLNSLMLPVLNKIAFRTVNKGNEVYLFGFTSSSGFSDMIVFACDERQIRECGSLREKIEAKYMRCVVEVEGGFVGVDSLGKIVEVRIT